MTELIKWRDSAEKVEDRIISEELGKMMIAIGTIRKEERIMPDGSKQLRDVVDIGATLDERIADGFYFVRSLKLVKHICAHPELLDRPLGEPSGFDFK